MTRAAASGSSFPSAIPITDASAASAWPNSLASISAFARSTVNRSCSTDAPASVASPARAAKDRDRRLERAVHRIRAAEGVDRTGIEEGAAPTSLERLLEQLDRLVQAFGTEGDLPEPGERGRATRVTRLQDARDRWRSASSISPIRSATSASSRSAWARPYERRRRSRATATRRRAARASSLTICSDGTRAPASRREMYAAVQPSNASWRCERPAVSQARRLSRSPSSRGESMWVVNERGMIQSSCLQSPMYWRHERCLAACFRRALTECGLAPGGCPSKSRFKETAHMRYSAVTRALAALLGSALILGGFELLAVGARPCRGALRRSGAPRGRITIRGRRASRTATTFAGRWSRPHAASAASPPPRPRGADPRLCHGALAGRATGPARRSAPSRRRASSARSAANFAPQSPLTQSALAEAIARDRCAPAPAAAAPTRACAQAGRSSRRSHANAIVGGLVHRRGRRAGPRRRPRRLRRRRHGVSTERLRALRRSTSTRRRSRTARISSPSTRRSPAAATRSRCGRSPSRMPPGVAARRRRPARPAARREVVARRRRAAVAHGARRPSTRSTARPPRACRVVKQLDAALVGYLGLGDAAREIQATLQQAGLRPPANTGTEAVARMLGLRLNHPAGEDDLELLPNQARHAPKPRVRSRRSSTSTSWATDACASRPTRSRCRR